MRTSISREHAGDDRLDSLGARAAQIFGSPRIWQDLKTAYSEPHRHYHTLAHLSAMFEWYDRHYDVINHPRAVALAIWFHDFIYAVDESYPQNEGLSAAKMLELLRHELPHLLKTQEGGFCAISLAAEMIVATKEHLATSPVIQRSASAVADAQLFLDIDLSILSRTRDVVLEFDRQVRQEFVRYDDHTFAVGRVQALSHLLARDRIYLSPHFAPFEAAARANLQMLVENWKGIAIAP